MGKPCMWTVWTFAKRETPEPGEQRDTYDTFQSAKEFATEWVERLGQYNAEVINTKGVSVFNARKSGVRKVAKSKR